MAQTNQKYELLDHDTVTTPSGLVLKRIRALVAIDSLVAAGELGGYIESEDNLAWGGNAWVSDNAWVSGNAWVSDNALVYGNALVSGNAWVEKRTDLFWISIIGSENGTYTAFKNKDGGILVNRGCFSGTLEEFTDAVNKRHEGKFNQEYQLVIELTKLRLGQQV